MQEEEGRLLRPDGRPCPLTRGEFAVLLHLHRAQGEPVSRDALSLAVLGRVWRPGDRAVDNLVLRMRRRIGDPQGRMIRSIRLVGYAMGDWRGAPG